MKIRAVRMSNVRVIIAPMTLDQSRHIFPYRPFIKGVAESRFGGSKENPDKKLLRRGDVIRCKMCHAPTFIRFLASEICPDCDGRYEYMNQVRAFRDGQKA